MASLLHILWEMRVDYFQQLWTKVSGRQHVTYTHHVFIAGNGNLTGDVGGGDDDIRAAQFTFVFTHRAAVHRVVDI